MIELYYRLVINKKRSCNTENKEVPIVPPNLRPMVLEMLNKNRYDADGNVTE